MYFSWDLIRKIYYLGFLFVIFLTLADLLVFFYYGDTFLGDIFLATREQTPLTWISSLSLFLIALFSVRLYFDKKEVFWYILSLLFLFFSMDDAIYLHERLSGFLAEKSGWLELFPTYVWSILYFPLLVVAIGFLVFFLYKNSQRKEKMYVCMAVFCLGLAFLLDIVDGFVQKDPTLVFCWDELCNIWTTHIMRLSEEVLEVIGIGILGFVLARKCCTMKKNDFIYNKKKGV